MTDRDTFAAAALTGLLGPDDVNSEFGETNYKLRACRMAYDWADAMLRERPRSGALSSREAVQSTDGDDITVRLTRWCEQPDDRTATQALMDQAAREIERLRFALPYTLTDAEREAVEAAVAEFSGLADEFDALKDAKRAATLRGLLAKEGGTVTPLYAQPQPTLTDEEREAIRWAAEIACADDGDDFALWNAAVMQRMLERMA